MSFHSGAVADASPYKGEIVPEVMSGWTAARQGTHR